MVGRSTEDYTFTADWSSMVDKIKLGDNCEKIDYEIDAKFEFSLTATMGGEKKMSPKEREVLTRLNEARAKSVENGAFKELQELVDRLEERIADIRHNTSLVASDRMKAIERECAATNGKIEALVDREHEVLEAIVTKNINGFVKGRHHFRKKVQQIVKHSVKVPLSLAAIPVGVVLSATGFATPVGIVATGAAIKNIKECADYIRVHKQGMVGLAVRIQKNVEFLIPTALEYAEAAEKLEIADKAQVIDDEARKKLKLVKHEINQREITAYALDTFLSVHKKSIEHLAELVDKYRKKVNKHKYEAIRMGRQIEKLTENLDAVKREHELNTKFLAKQMQKVRDDPKSPLAALFADIEKATEKLDGKLADLPKEIKTIEKALDAEIDLVSTAEATFEAWVEQVEHFKSQRPKAVHDWKKGIKAIAFAQFVTEVSLGGASDALGGVSTALEVVTTVIGAAQSAYDGISSNFDDAKKILEKATA